ncbi:MAG: M60 family metallopeptidase [Bacteroidaceae bacterium]|nr:M60 family metallopeptidase [Bacteroidaceae bacterium]
MQAQSQEWEGKILSVGENVTTLQTGEWYFLYNPSTLSYTKEGTGNTLGPTTISPNGLDASSGAGYLVQLEATETEGKYYLKSGLGNYYANMTTSKNNGTSATVATKYVYTIAEFGSAGHWTLKSTLYFMQCIDGQLKGASSIGSAGGDRDWVFKKVVFTGLDDLEGSAFVKYVLNKGGLVRLTNRRYSSTNLTDDNSQTLGVKADVNSLQQVWILDKKGDGYTLRNGSTGRYLSADDNFRSPSTTAKTLYIQYSPNNSNNSTYINVAEKSDFSGNICLNLNGTTLYKWTCQGDIGSDWDISMVENYSLEDVEAGLLSQSEFKEPKVGKYYRIRNMGYSTYMNEDFSNNSINCEEINADKLSQYWTLVSSGTAGKYFMQNLCTERYITRQGGALSTQYKTQASSPNAGYSLTRTGDATNVLFYIIDNGSVGLHCAASGNVVGWYTTDIAGSTWGFEEVELTDEFIQEGRSNLKNYSDLKTKIGTYKAALANLFRDNACTELKEDIQALSDEALAENTDFMALNDDMKAMVLKVKNNTWQSYTSSTGYTREGFEKFFRIRDDYQVYSHYQQMAENGYAGMSNSFGKLSGPTGIVGNAGDIIYIYLDEEPSADCTLQAEVVADSDSPGDHQTGTTTSLHAGLNTVLLSNPSTLYIFYQLNNPEKYLANYPNAKIHIEGGELQGYFDYTRGMTNEDWTLLYEKMLNKSKIVNFKCDRIVFAMLGNLVKNAIGKTGEVEGLMRVWNNFVECEEDLMGFKEDLQGRLRNVWNAFSVNHGYMYASTYGTYYSDSTIGTVMNYNTITASGGAIWGPSHEIGHNHQSCINIVGATEVSNNLFSNVNVFLHGVSTTRGSKVTTTLDNFAKGTGWFGMGIWEQTRLYYQLYLYFHAQGHKPDFYPTLFKMLRKDPMRKRTGPSYSNLTDGDGNVVSGVITYGKDDYLHLAKKMCDAAQLDLSELFEVNGMFVPYDKFFVGDYSNYWVTTTEKDIEEAKAYMHRYPKAPSICFIDDRIKPSPSISDGPFEGRPKGQNRVAYDDGEVPIGYADVGQWSDFVNDYQTNGFFYATTTSQGVTTYSITGTGAIGYKVYDKAGNLVYLSDKNKFNFPSYVQSKIQGGFSIVACEANGYEVLVPFAPSLYRGEMTAYYEGNPTPHTLYYYGTGTAGVSEMNPLPANSIAYIKPGQSDKKQPTEGLLANTNVVNGEGLAQSLVIDGDKTFYIPADFNAQQVRFTKSGTGYQALRLPFAVKNGYVGTITNHQLDTSVENIAAGDPVVVDGNIDIVENDVMLNAFTYAQMLPGYVLDAEGKSVVAADDVSPFTYIFSEAFNLGDDETSVKSLTPALSEGEGAVYDLSGRLVNLSTRQLVNSLKKGIYIVNGKKVLR